MYIDHFVSTNTTNLDTIRTIDVTDHLVINVSIFTIFRVCSRLKPILDFTEIIIIIKRKEYQTLIVHIYFTKYIIFNNSIYSMINTYMQRIHPSRLSQCVLLGTPSTVHGTPHLSPPLVRLTQCTEVRRHRDDEPNITKVDKDKRPFQGSTKFIKHGTVLITTFPVNGQMTLNIIRLMDSTQSVSFRVLNFFSTFIYEKKEERYRSYQRPSVQQWSTIRSNKYFDCLLTVQFS